MTRSSPAAREPAGRAAGSSGRTRWHREPLVWMVLAIPAVAVIAGAVMLVLANITWDGLVADDYYRRGMQINRSLARDAEAARRELHASVSFLAPGIVTVRLTTRDGSEATPDHEPPTLRFARAARTGADITVALTLTADGAWHGVLPEMPPGKWYVELGNDRWRLMASVRAPVSPAVIVLRARTMNPPGNGSS